jgi:hypothetical protein
MISCLETFFILLVIFKESEKDKDDKRPKNGLDMAKVAT